MKNYMMILMGPDYEAMGLSPEEIQQRMEKWFVWGDKMEKANQVVGGEALHGAAKRIIGKDKVVQDGPFGESKDLVGGYYIVRANSVEEVMDIAQDFPDYELDGSVEIREVVVFD